MIRIPCPHCGEKLKAPDELAGRRTRCPGCRGIVTLEVPAEPDEFAGSPQVTEEMPAIKFSVTDDDPTESIIHESDSTITFKAPKSLRRSCLYLICNSKDIVARWEDDGKGWMVHIKDGFVRATQNPKQIPTMGNYVFIEIEATNVDGQQKLTGVHVFAIDGAFALNKLAKKNENLILEELSTTASLNDQQRAHVKQRINAKFLPSIWDTAAEF